MYNKINVISANTDGIVSYVPNNKKSLFEKICFNWEFITNFELEGTTYKAYHSRDVNNYLAIKTNGEVKEKGVFTKTIPTKTGYFTSCINFLTKGEIAMSTIPATKA